MKELKIKSETYGTKIVLVDDEDWVKVKDHNWFVLKDRNTFYARTFIKRKSISMHRLLMGNQNKPIDHRDRNGLNNQKSNLRIATNSQNAMNKPPQKNGSSRFKGVSWNKREEKWEVNIVAEGVRFHLGKFDNEEMAGKAYNQKARTLHKDFAYINQL